jgi:hypothetical protein
MYYTTVLSRAVFKVLNMCRLCIAASYVAAGSGGIRGGFQDFCMSCERLANSHVMRSRDRAVEVDDSVVLICRAFEVDACFTEPNVCMRVFQY